MAADPCPRPECGSPFTRFDKHLAQRVVETTGPSGQTIKQSVPGGQQHRCMKCGKPFTVAVTPAR